MLTHRPASSPYLSDHHADKLAADPIRLVLYVHGVVLSAVGAAQVRGRIQPDRLSLVLLRLVDCHTDCHGGVASGSSAAADRQLYEPSSGRFEQRIVG